VSVDFVSPSFRASSGDLTVSISPLGLVELADEEFEVHGPRLNRYAQNWAWFLGHHWSHRREMGEPQLTFNYVEAFASFINNFCFGRGVYFRTPLATSAIVPSLLSRVWEVDNDKESLLLELGQLGGVSGDCFIKVAYEEPWVDPAGGFHAGRVRVLPINGAHAFPEFHPHDRNRLLRFKLKYKFWGTTADGTRQVFTYTEILTDTQIEEYINDELLDARPNPLGVIPVVHIPNTKVSGSPWGLSDIGGIISLNREYNEKATDVSDIINYHAAPVTVITGAKASQLEKGPKKVWGGLPKDAQVFNLELGANLGGPMDYLAMLKKSMHELTGVPEGALGDVQPISNTSGVALAIQYTPMMQRYRQKTTNYGQGIRRVNELILRTLAVKEPLTFQWDPSESDELKDGQLPVLDPDDPVTYQTECHWPPPLPVDILIKLNEVQMKMALGLESKRGALRELGEEFPDNKSREIFLELVEDAIDQGALDMLKSQISAAVLSETGMLPSPDGPQPDVTSAGGAGVSTAGGGAGGGAPAVTQPVALPPEVGEMVNQLNTRAYGTKLSQRRNPANDDND
jgi:hypothetical protein